MSDTRCRCVPGMELKNGVLNLTAEKTLEDILFQSIRNTLQPVRILKNGPAMVVFWQDGSKTVVKPGPNVTPNDYDAFTAALAIKVFGNNSHLKKMIRALTVDLNIETEG